MGLLEVEGFSYQDYTAHSKSFQLVREVLLQLWEQLMKELETCEDQHDILNYYKIILLIMKRKEFDNSHLHLDVHDQPTCPQQDLLIAYQYRTLLYQTQMYINKNLCKPTQFSKAHNLNLFCARVLAVTTFRIPWIGEKVMRAFALDIQQLAQFLETFQKEQSIIWPLQWAHEQISDYYSKSHPVQSKTTLPNTNQDILPSNEAKKSKEEGKIEDEDKNNGNSGALTAHIIDNYMDNRKSLGMDFYDEDKEETKKSIAEFASQSKKLRSSFPTLFKWTMFHAALKEKITDDLDEQLYVLSGEWINNLAKRDNIFFVFLKEWIIHIKSCIGDSSIRWELIRGYSVLLHTFLHDFKLADQYPKPLMDASIVFLMTDRNLINLYLRMIFPKTNVFQLSQVLDCLNTIEMWLKEIKNTHKTLPPTFDSSYFCKALAIILDTDHHQMIGKLLALLYNYSEVFVGDPRTAVYCNLLLEKYFYHLFLHWDDNVRNSFQQIIVFKLIRMKRSVLHEEGVLNIEELASRDLGLKSSSNKKRSSTPAEDHERYLDAVLYAKVESFVKMIQDQLRDQKVTLYDKTLEVYVPKALSEYKMYLSRYYSWERSGEEEPPKLVPMHMLSEAEIEM